jgi:hypothetical protein
MGMIDSFLHPERGYEAAGNEIGKSWNEAKGYLQPYNQYGMNQMGRLNRAENSLLDPSKLLAKWMAGYETSPYAQQLQEQASQAGLDSASQQGLLGSSAALSNVQNTSSQIMNADRQNYLKDLMEKYMAGIGLGKDIFNTGANAGSQLNQGALHTGENMAQAELGRLNAPGEMFGKMLGTGASILSSYLSGGMK